LIFIPKRERVDASLDKSRMIHIIRPFLKTRICRETLSGIAKKKMKATTKVIEMMTSLIS